MTGLLLWLVRRVAFGALTLLAIAAITYGMARVLLPQHYPDTPVISGTLHDLERGFLHFDWGVACGWPGCPPIRVMFDRGYAADLWLIGGALVIGITAGLLGAIWCARRPHTRRARVVEVAVTTTYCAPVYVVGFGLLLLFNAQYGVLGIPAVFDAQPAWAEPWTDPWVWFKVLAVPWVVLGAPIAAMCLRMTLASLRQDKDALHVRTAFAKGVRSRRVMSRHVAPPAYTQTASFIAVSIPFMVLNLALVETVFDVPGFFVNLQRATGRTLDVTGNPVIDFPMVEALAIWAAVLIIALGIAVDLAIARLDPRIRSGGLPG